MADKRLTPARPDLAASYLKGTIEAARFADGELASVIQGRAALRARPSGDAPQDSELLLGETVTVYERKAGWAWVQAKADSYVGYVQEAALGPNIAADARVILPLTPLLSRADVKSPLRDLLPMNARVRRGSAEGDFVQVAGGFVHARALAPLGEKASDFVAIGRTIPWCSLCLGRQDFSGP